jgi:hypothetical protein
MSPWGLNRLAVGVVWILGLVGPLLNAEVQTITTWSIFAVAVSVVLTVLEKIDVIILSLLATGSNSERLAGIPDRAA